jgi:virginiamycin B lyase
MAIDGSHLYWTVMEGGTIGRANLDGTGLNQTFITGANWPTGIKVDTAHIYWSNAGPPNGPAGTTIGRANIDGTGVNQRFITRAFIPAGLAIQQP